MPKPKDGFPSVDEQLAQFNVQPDSALAKLIRENQDFDMLPEEELKASGEEGPDKIGLPLWMRVYWRKQHPEAELRAGDPTGGYPHSLHRLLEWMVTHQDLQPES